MGFSGGCRRLGRRAIQASLSRTAMIALAAGDMSEEGYAAFLRANVAPVTSS
jgi:hypothetical protein